MTTRVLIELVEVTCKNTEDITGADTFYLAGGLSDGESSEAILTPNLWINDGQTSSYNHRLWDREVVDNGFVSGGIVAFDEDMAKEYERIQERLPEITKNIKLAAGVVATVAAMPEATALAGLVIDAAMGAFTRLAPLDKDDQLGTLTLTVPASGPNREELTWEFKGGRSSYSDWNYSVRYRINRWPVAPSDQPAAQ